MNRRKRQRRAEDPERAEAAAAYSRGWYENNQKVKRDYHLKSTYGITLDQYDEMLEKQKGVCSICHEECSTGRNLSVDHCHASGRVRDLLCGNCNKALGLFRDSPELLSRAAEYLAFHSFDIMEHLEKLDA